MGIAKYDMHMLKNIGIDVEGYIWDTMLMIHLINEEQYCRMPGGGAKRSKKLKDLAYHFLGEDGHKYEDAIKEVKKELAKEKGIPIGAVSYKDISDRAPQAMADYAISDTWFTYRLYELFLPRLIEQGLEGPYNRDLAALKAVFEMERVGLKVDIDGLKAYRTQMTEEIIKIQNRIYRIAGKTFNIKSDKELVGVFESLDLAWRWFTDKGNYSTDKSVITYLRNSNGSEIEKDGAKVYAPSNPIGQLADDILKYRSMSKDMATFIEGLINFSDPAGRVHTDFNICPQDDGKGGTVTGRLSSSNPNLQNLSKKNMDIRKMITADKEFILIECDFSQQEYRVLAHYSKDPSLISAIEQGWDVHQATAAMLNHKPYEEVTKEERKKAKSVNFGQR